MPIPIPASSLLFSSKTGAARCYRPCYQLNRYVPCYRFPDGGQVLFLLLSLQEACALISYAGIHVSCRVRRLLSCLSGGHIEKSRNFPPPFALVPPCPFHQTNKKCILPHSRMCISDILLLIILFIYLFIYNVHFKNGFIPVVGTFLSRFLLSPAFLATVKAIRCQSKVPLVTFRHHWNKFRERETILPSSSFCLIVLYRSCKNTSWAGGRRECQWYARSN